MSLDNIDLDARVQDLSIASRQVVAICRALASEARLIIMDEPTASLNPKEIRQLLKIVGDLKSQGVSIVFVSHKLEEVLSISDRVTVLRNGEKVGTYEASEMTQRELSHLMTGREFDYEPTRFNGNPDNPVLRIDGLGRKGEFEDASFGIGRGEIVALTGPMGAGRTELALSLFGITSPETGSVHLEGREVSFSNNRQAIAAGICYLSEDRITYGLVVEQPIAANILVSLFHRIANQLGIIRDRDRRSAVKTWIEKLSIKTQDPQNPVSSLSGGNQQRVALAKWMARDPKVLILDSPTVGVDVNAKDGIYRIIHDLAAEGVSILLISDEVQEVFHHSHRVLVMKAGRIVDEIHPADTTEADLERAVYA